MKTGILASIQYQVNTGSLLPIDTFLIFLLDLSWNRFHDFYFVNATEQRNINKTMFQSNLNQNIKTIKHIKHSKTNMAEFGESAVSAYRKGKSVKVFYKSISKYQYQR